MPIQEDPKQISAVIEYALGSPASRVGRRLRSEPDLAAIFKVGRWHVRKSIDELVRKGVLVRRKGSGTYVQRIPAIGEDRAGLVNPHTALMPESLFAETGAGDNGTAVHVPMERQSYHIGTWGNYLYRRTPVNEAIMAGLSEGLSEKGHRLSIHSVFGVSDQEAPSLERLIDQLRRHPCDGYLVMAPWAARFLEALGPQHAPVVAFWTGYWPDMDIPQVIMDDHAALSRAVSLLAEQGHRRIGLISLGGGGRNEASQKFCYEQAMQAAGLDYRAVEFTASPSISDAMAVTRRMLAREEPPEAIYVDDDYVVAGVAEVLAMNGIEPGRDLAVITYANRGVPLPQGYNWSRMEFDQADFWGALVDVITRAIRTGHVMAGSMAIHPRWAPGQTHKQAQPTPRQAARVAVRTPAEAVR